MDLGKREVERRGLVITVIADLTLPQIRATPYLITYRVQAILLETVPVILDAETWAVGDGNVAIVYRSNRSGPRSRHL